VRPTVRRDQGPSVHPAKCRVPVRGRCGCTAPSGPNSVPGRAPGRPLVSTPRVAAWLYSDGSSWCSPTGQCSTLEHRPRNERPWRGPGRTPKGSARCSLERR